MCINQFRRMKITLFYTVISAMILTSSCSYNFSVRCEYLRNSINLIQYELEIRRSPFTLPEIDGLGRGTWLQLTLKLESLQKQSRELSCQNS